MRKRRKKRVIVDIDDEGCYLNCYGERVKWTRKEIRRFFGRNYEIRKIKEKAKEIKWI